MEGLIMLLLIAISLLGLVSVIYTIVFVFKNIKRAETKTSKFLLWLGTISIILSFLV